MKRLAQLELENGAKIDIEVETEADGSLRPFSGDKSEGPRVLAKLGELVDGVSGLARSVYEAVRAGAQAPSDINIEFGIKFGGKTGIILASGSVESHAKISLSWKAGTAH